MVKYAILGVIQGVFEWLPVSSEGVLTLVSRFWLNGPNPVDIALFLHAGTLFASLIYFRREWVEIISFRDREKVKFLLLATPFSLLVGFFVYKFARNIALEKELLLFMGFALLLTAYFNYKRKMFNFSLPRLAIISGILQGFAALPGLSRSGSTIFALSFGRLKPNEILSFSYIMSVPVIIAANLYLLATGASFFRDGWVSLLFSFFVGYFFLHFLMKFSEKTNYAKLALFFALCCFICFLVL